MFQADCYKNRDEKIFSLHSQKQGIFISIIYFASLWTNQDTHQSDRRCIIEATSKDEREREKNDPYPNMTYALGIRPNIIGIAFTSSFHLNRDSLFYIKIDRMWHWKRGKNVQKSKSILGVQKIDIIVF